MQKTTITHLERRKIEAGVLIPMVQAFQRALGKEQANEIVREVIVELARRDGERWAQQFGRDLAAMEQVCGVWASGGSLEIEQIGKSSERLDFNVTRCKYNRDFAMVEGFSPTLKLKRTQTIMEGADYCDFRFVLKG